MAMAIIAGIVAVAAPTVLAPATPVQAQAAANQVAIDKQWTNAPIGSSASIGAWIPVFFDQFNTQAYSNNNGPSNWGSNWTDSEDGDATAGTAQISSNRLRFANLDGVTLQRSINLAGLIAANVQLGFVFAAESSNGESLDIKLRPTAAANWTTVATVSNDNDATPSIVTRVNIPSNLLAATSQIQFASGGDGSWNNGDVIEIDDVWIGYGGTATATAGTANELDQNVVTLPAVNNGTVSFTETSAGASQPSATCAVGSAAAATVTLAGDPPTGSYAIGASGAAGRTCTLRNTYSAPNPNLAADCGTDVVVVLDESGSIDSSNAVTNVSTAVQALAQGLSNTGSRMRLVEFATDARNVSIGGDVGFKDVNTSYVTTLTAGYLRNLADTNNGIPLTNSDTYNPNSNGGDTQYTNWEAGLAKALPGAPLVVFITDGDPNTVGTTGSSTNNNQPDGDLAAREAIDEANGLKANGQHVLAIGVGNGVTSTTSFARLLNLVEPVGGITWSGTGDLDVTTTDALKVTDFSALGTALRRVVFALCAPALSITKHDQDGNAVTGFPFTATVDVNHSGTGAIDRLDWISPDDGIVATLPSTKTLSTDSSGSVLFQWAPNSRTDPKPWDSVASFSEVMPTGWTPGWTAAALPTCGVQRLRTDGTIADFTVTVTPAPMVPTGGQTVTFTFNANAASGFDGTIKSGDIVKCAIVNKRPASLLITKTTTGGNGTFNFDVVETAGATTVVPLTTSAGTATSAPQALTAGKSYTVTEQTPTGWAPSPASRTLTCTQQLSNQTPVQATSVGNPFTAVGGATYRCTITNTKLGSITIIKDAVQNNAQDFAFTTTGLSSFSLDDDAGAIGANATLSNSQTFTNLAPATYTVTEVAADGWTLSDLACTSNATIDTGTRKATITLPAGADVTCTFTNTAITPKLTIVKNTVGGNGTFTFDVTNLTAAGGLGLTTSGTPTSGSATSAAQNLAVGTSYTVSERDLAGWTKGTLTCEVDPAGSAGPTPVANLFVAAPGAVYTCTITNTKLGKITIIKDAVPNNAQDFAFTATGSGVSGFSLDDDSDSTLSNTKVFNDLAAGTYTFTEALTAGWTLSDLVCAPTAGTSVSTGTRTASITLAAGADVTCTFTNSQRAPLTIDKTASTAVAVAGQPGVFDVTYSVVVTNPGTASETFVLADTPDMATGVTFAKQSASVVPSGAPINAGWNGTSDTNLAGGTIAGGATYTYTIVLRVTVAATATADARTCATADTANRGAFNKATLTWDGNTIDDTACATLPNPNITVDKSPVAGSLTQVGGTWTVDYDIVVRNAGAGAGTYTLVDTPAFDPSVTVSSVALISSTPAIAAPAPGTTSLTVVTDRVIAAGSVATPTTHSYRIRVTFAFKPAPAGNTSTVTTRDCTLGTEPGTGTFNAATVTPNIGTPTTDDGCLPLPAPALDVTKTVTAGPTFAAGAWTVTYNVAVAHAVGSIVPAQYDLVDTPTVGAGITVTKVASGVLQDTTTPFSLDLATDKNLAVGATDNYSVTVTFLVEGPPPALVCPTGGVSNTALVTWQDGTDTSTACATVPDISITKSAPANVSTTATPGEYTTTYTVVVTNKSAANTYNLVDAFNFASSVDVVGVDSVGFVAAPADITDPAFVANTSGVTASNVAIAAGSAATPTTHTWTITVRVRLDGDESADATTCAVTDTVDRGLFNRATVSIPGYSASDTACSDLPKPAITIEKTPDAGTATGPVAGVFTATYTVKVINSGTAPGRYSLTDTPVAVAGTTITSIAVVAASPAVNISPYTSGAAIVTNQAIAATTTHTYTVTVTFTVATVTSTTIENFDCATGTPVDGKGQVNTATITVNGNEFSDTGCVSVPKPVVEVVKTAVPGSLAYDQATSTYTVDYTITVTNTGTVPTQFTLTDTALGDAGVTPGTTVVTPTPVANTTIQPGAANAQSYTARVTYTVDPAAAGFQYECGSESNPTGGLANRASITFPGGTDSDDGCVDLPNVTVTKTAPATATAVAGTPGDFDTTYTVTVANSGVATSYDLTDAFDFASTVQIVSASATVDTDGPSGSAPVTVAGFTGAIPTNVLATNTAIAAGSVATPTTHIYVISVRVRLNGDETPNQLTCAGSNGDRGLFNLATLTVVGRTTSDDACTTVPTTQVMLSKTTTSVAAELAWSFDFAISPVPQGQTGLATLSGTGPGAGSSKTWTNLLPGLTYTISETVPAGWSSVLTCSGVSDTDGNDANNSVTFVAGTGAITCAATNTPLAPTLEVVKTTIGDTGTFGFTLTPADITGLSVTAVDPGTEASTAVRTGLVTGRPYNLAEIDPGTSWVAGQLTCTEDPAGTPVAAPVNLPFTAKPGAAYRCEITNTKQATVVVRKVVQGADGTFSFGGDVPGLASIAATTGAPGSFTAANVAPGGYTVTESAAPGWDLVSVVCVDGTDSAVESTIDLAARQANIEAEAGETVTCTFTNAKQGSITINKVATPVLADDFAFTTGNGLSPFVLDVDPSSDTPASTTFTGLSAGTYTVSETVLAGWALESIVCTDPTSNSSGTGSTATIVLAPGETVSCTFDNRAADATITIDKTTVGGDDTFDFVLDGLNGADDIDLSALTIDGSGSTGAQALTPGRSYTVSEIDPGPAWIVGTMTCSVLRAGADETSTLSTTFTVQPGDNITCAITNTKKGTIIVVKNVEGANATFDFEGSFASPTGFTITTVGDATGGTGNQTFTNIAASTYTLTELNLPADYDGRLICSENGTENTTVDGLAGSIVLEPGETVTCTFTNTQRSTIIVDKVTVPSEDPTEFNFELNGADNPFVLTDEAEPFNSGLLVPGTYTVAELDELNWQLTGLTCSTGPLGSAAAIDGPAATITLLAGDSITCTYTNSKLGDVSVDKTAGPVTLVAANRYSVDYTIIADNASYVAETYDVVDALSFGANTTIVSATVLAKPASITPVTGWNGQDATLLVDDGVIAARSQHSYTVRVVFDVAPTITPDDRDCVGTETTGTLNTVRVTFRNGADDDAACTPIPAPKITVAKTVNSAPVRGADGVWTISYDVTATNAADGGPGTYAVNDTLEFGGGVTVTSVTPSGVTPGVTVKPDFNGIGQTLLAEGTLNAGGTHVYRVTVTATVAPGAPGQGDCALGTDPGTGFLNQAVITVDGVTGPPATACAPFSTLTLNKVLVNDNGGDAVLSDFVLSAVATVPGDAAAVISGVDPNASTTVGIGAAVVPGTYTLDETNIDGYTAGSWDCTGASVNNGVVTVVEATDAVCTITNDDDPVDLELTKDDGGAIAVAGGPAYDYTITVANIGTRDADLDEPVTVTDILPAGLTFAGVASNCSISGQTATCSIDPALLTVGAEPVVITLSVRLAAGAPSGTYVNKAFVTTEDDPACVGDGCVPECPADNDGPAIMADTPGSNVDCEPTTATREATITVTKTDSVAEPVQPGATYSYAIVVTNNGPSSVDRVTITDDLPSMLTLVSAAGSGWTCGPVDPVNCVWSGTLAPGATAPTVTVTVTLDPGYLGTVIDNVAVARATVDDKGTPDPSDDDTTTDDDDEQTPVVIAADLAIVKTSSTATPTAGATFEWILDVTNLGPQTAYSVVVTDQVPNLVTVTAVNSSQFDCSAIGNAVTCTKASMTLGEQGRIVVTVSVPAGLPAQTIENVGKVTSSTPDPDLTNNQDPDTVLTQIVVVLPPLPVIPEVIPTLPITGSDLGRFVAVSFALLAAGWCLVIGRRRRRDNLS